MMGNRAAKLVLEDNGAHHLVQKLISEFVGPVRIKNLDDLDETRVVTATLPWLAFCITPRSHKVDCFFFQEMLQGINMMYVTRVDLSCADIDVASCQEFSIILSSNSTIQELDLAFNHFGDEGGEALAKALSVNSTLTGLDLAFTDLGDTGAYAIAQALFSNMSLCILKVPGNGFSNDAIKALVSTFHSAPARQRAGVCLTETPHYTKGFA